MRRLIGPVIAATLALGGCAAPPIETPASDSVRLSRGGNVDASPLHVRGKSPDSRNLPEKSRADAGLRPALQLREGDRRESTVIPDAIIKIDPSSMRLTPEMESRLQRIADEAKQDDRSIIRLESYVPAGGSPAFDLGIADKTAQIVKERLQMMGISSRRMSLASFGAEHDEALDSHRHWVEVYVLKTGHSNGNNGYTGMVSSPTSAAVRK
jgi:outer membrane protein OmpA-like peptidoglycan-associated protein